MNLRYAVVVALVALAAQAADLTPVGRWTTVDDKTGKPKGIVQIYQQNGQLFGKVEASLDPAKAGKRCDKCSDSRKDQPIVGMVIMRDMKRDGDWWDGGDILDPDTGSVYRCKIKLTDGGRKLLVRGYRGISLLGRSQTWTRRN
jgi:uncharacterized protein (DUF2147 family)